MVRCYDCNVWLQDEDALRNHKLGKPHLKQQQRIKEDYARRADPNYGSTTRTGMSYYESPSQFAERCDEFNRGNAKREQKDSDSDDENRYSQNSYGGYGNRRSRSPLARHTEEPREDRNANAGTSIYAQYRPKLDPNIKKVNGKWYCEPCDTYCSQLDVMQAHLSGKNHKKKTKEITRFTCDLCLIEVSSAETLQTHYQGMSHIKRAKVQEEAKKEIEYPTYYQNEEEEFADLQARCQKLERQNANLQKEVEGLHKFKIYCINNHRCHIKLDVDKQESKDVFLE